ncbi:hypothetical protein CR205_11210 [Alteribacter lacisalsi]|uniref:Uncharacterized protein n=1 Tax=Alteribacter lacisalsi TaxID=2045244 RepID=A0A2W0HND6_9BACI|nr:hypothetical protein [Alteribacter lacisalsi]PYZ99095.1 hypothetical protein CR205_11210 [Alteribacter lacisalsi]
MSLLKPATFTEYTTINVIDSIMGSGKSSWAIQYMNSSPARKKFIYITPFADEVERIISECTYREFVKPSNAETTKLVDIKKLIAEGLDIASTHSLFQRVDAELIELLEIEDYTLILDEVMDVIAPLNEYTKSDLKLLHNEGIIRADENGLVHWDKPDYDSDEGYFTKIRNLAYARNLMMYEDEAGEPVVLYWTFPASTFKCFDDVFLLTYLFHGQVQRAYFDLFKINYKYSSVSEVGGEYMLKEYVDFSKEDREHIKKNINIYHPAKADRKDMNKLGNRRTDFSVSNLRTRHKQSAVKKVIRDNAYNFYRNKCKVPASEVMWTTFKEFTGRGGITPHGLNEGFVQVSSRATNEYKDKTTCIYLANRFLNPVTKQFFGKHGIEVDEELYALSELLQWLFRSQIRDGKPINLYIPSKRMRTLLKEYLGNDM